MLSFFPTNFREIINNNDNEETVENLRTHYDVEIIDDICKSEDIFNLLGYLLRINISGISSLLAIA